ncbi:MAG: Cbp1 family collagen-binding glycoprotein adhesin, partial [Bacteroidia bacterium]
KENLEDYKTGFMALETAFDFLQLDNVALAETVTDETDQLHTAYYITGSLKQLQKDSVVDRKGGFLGLGKTKTLKNQFSQRKFKKIDYSKTSTIPIYAKKANIVTHHSSESYHLNKDKEKIQSLTITDPVKFWEVSRYLVIITE